MDTDLFYMSDGAHEDGELLLGLQAAPLPPTTENSSSTASPAAPTKRNATPAKKTAAPPAKKAKTTTSSPTTVIMPVAKLVPAKLGLAMGSDPLPMIIQRSSELAWFPFVQNKQPDIKMLFRLDNVNHFGVKVSDYGTQFSVTNLSQAQRLGISQLENFVVNVELDYELLFGMGKDDLTATTSVVKHALFKGYFGLKLKEDVRFWSKDGKLQKEWYGKATEGDLKKTKGAYDIIFTAGLYYSLDAPDGCNLKRGLSCTITDIKHRGPITDASSSGAGAFENGLPPPPTTCPF